MNAEKKAAIAARLEQIASANEGRLTPDAVVADARDEDSPLHDQFEWDTEKAAMAHWLYQARSLIRSVQVEIRCESRIVSTVAYVRDPRCDSGGQGYISTVALKDEQTLAREALTSEFARVRAIMQRAVNLADALGLRADVVDIAERIEMLQGKLSIAA